MKYYPDMKHILNHRLQYMVIFTIIKLPKELSGIDDFASYFNLPSLNIGSIPMYDYDMP